MSATSGGQSSVSVREAATSEHPTNRRVQFTAGDESAASKGDSAVREGVTAAQSVFLGEALCVTIFGPKNATTNPSPQAHLVPAISGLELVHAVRTPLGLQPQQVFFFRGFERLGDPPTTLLRDVLWHK
jgi:hypothetical protein